MSNDLWRWADPDGIQRKVQLDELRAALADGRIASNTPVWRSGWAKWQPAHEVPELSANATNGALDIPPPPLAMVAVQKQFEAASGSLAPPGPEAEPPPPPAYIPVQRKSLTAPLKTQLGGSAHVPAATPAPAPPTPRPAQAQPQSPPSLPTAIGLPASPNVPTTVAVPGSPGLPTTIGVPPPPELIAAVRAKGQTPPAPPALTTEPETLPDDAIEELSGSMLQDSPSTNELPPSPPTYRSDEMVTDPFLDSSGHPEGDTDPDAVSARRPGFQVIRADLADLRQGRMPRNKLLVAVLGIVTVSVLIMIVAGIVSLASGPSTDPKKTAASAAPSASAPGTATTTAASHAAIPPPPPAEETKIGNCTATGEPKSIAPRAIIASGIEAQALSSGLALGFAAGPRDAVATALDPSTLAPSSTVRTKPNGGDARRVTPLLLNGKLTAMPDVDRKGDPVISRRIVATSTLVDVGFAESSVVWAPHGRETATKLFPLDSDAAGEALRAIPLPDQKGFALTFRRGNAIHIGVAKGSLEADGSLATVNGLGQLGSPAIAASGDQVIVAWADRAGADDEWKIRFTRMKVGGSAGEATTFSVPEGGLGGHVMSPSVASLGGGRFLLAWTEGPVSSHQVRAITMNADGSMSGSAMAISGSGLNAGQPAAAVGADGRGVVAFLAAKGKSLEVHATPISCSR